MGAAQSEISGKSREEVAKEIFELLDDDNSKRVDMDELTRQGCHDMVTEYFRNSSQSMSETQFVNAILLQWKELDDKKYNEAALALYKEARDVIVGTDKEEKIIKECKDREGMCNLVFETLDDDGSKSICFHELTKQLDPQEKMKTLLPSGQYTNKYWDAVFAEYDKDKSGCVSQKEFSTALLTKYKDAENDLFVKIMASMLKKGLLHNARKKTTGEKKEEKKQ